MVVYVPPRRRKQSLPVTQSLSKSLYYLAWPWVRTHICLSIGLRIKPPRFRCLVSLPLGIADCHGVSLSLNLFLYLLAFVHSASEHLCLLTSADTLNRIYRSIEMSSCLHACLCLEASVDKPRGNCINSGLENCHMKHVLQRRKSMINVFDCALYHSVTSRIHQMYLRFLHDPLASCVRDSMF